MATSIRSYASDMSGQLEICSSSLYVNWQTCGSFHEEQSSCTASLSWGAGTPSAFGGRLDLCGMAASYVPSRSHKSENGPSRAF